MPYTIPPTVAVRLPISVPAYSAVLAELKQPLPNPAAALYQTLHGLAIHAAQHRGQSLQASQGVVHQAVELLAAHLGISRPTFYKHLATLQRHGLIHARGHTSSYGGLARKDGTLFAVSLRPGHRARLRHEDLKHQWRDLAADIASGTRTAWHFLTGVNSHSKEKKRRVEEHHLKAWALNPGQTETPLKNDCKGATQEYVYSLDLLSETHPKRRAEAVDSYARALSAGYGDSSNLNFWCWVLWRSLEADRRGEGALWRLQNALTRLAADVQEWAGLKKPGALLVYRLRECGLWDALRSPNL